MSGLQITYIIYSEDGADFSIEDLADLILATVGEGGLWVFGLGFIAAAISSMLTTALGAVLTIESMFTVKREDIGEKICENSPEFTEIDLEDDVQVAKRSTGKND